MLSFSTSIFINAESGWDIEKCHIKLNDYSGYTNTTIYEYELDDVGEFKFVDAGSVKDSYIAVSCERGLFRFGINDRKIIVTIGLYKNNKLIQTIETSGIYKLDPIDDDYFKFDTFIISGNTSVRIWEFLNSDINNFIEITAPRILIPQNFIMVVPHYYSFKTNDI